MQLLGAGHLDEKVVSIIIRGEYNFKKILPLGIEIDDLFYLGKLLNIILDQEHYKNDVLLYRITIKITFSGFCVV